MVESEGKERTRSIATKCNMGRTRDVNDIEVAMKMTVHELSSWLVEKTDLVRESGGIPTESGGSKQGINMGETHTKLFTDKYGSLTEVRI